MYKRQKEEPYGLILNFDKEPVDEVEFYQRMLKKSAEFLMLTENAGSVEWTYPIQNAGKEETRRFICDVDMLERMSGIENIKQYAGSKKAVQEFLTEHLADVRVHYENIGVLLEKFQSPVGKLYQMSSYVVGREEGAEFDRVYSVLMNASTVTMEDVQEAIDAGGATDKIYVVKEVDAANENDFIIE